MVTTVRVGDDISPECTPGGSGNCDGYGPGGECECPCHTADDLPRHASEMQAWHASQVWGQAVCVGLPVVIERLADGSWRVTVDLSEASSAASEIGASDDMVQALEGLAGGSVSVEVER